MNFKKYSDELIDFSNPMIFLNPEIEHYDCSILGTYFIIDFYKQLYAVTASHVLGNIEAHKCGFGSFKYYNEVLPLSNKYSIHPFEKYKDDNDFCDLNIIEIDMPKMLPIQKSNTKGYMIDQLFFDEIM